MRQALKTTGRPLAIALLSVVGASQVFAADPIEYQVQLIATVPSSSFYVVPASSGWIGQPQRMEWMDNPSAAGGKLTSVDKEFDVKNSSGAISARLSDDEAYLYNGADKIDLNVSFNGKKLSTSSEEVVSSLEANAWKRVRLLIAAAASTVPYAPGSYSGIVNMTFDAMPPVPR